MRISINQQRVYIYIYIYEIQTSDFVGTVSSPHRMPTGTKTVSKLFECFFFFFVFTQARLETKNDTTPTLVARSIFTAPFPAVYNKDVGYHCSAQISLACSTKQITGICSNKHWVPRTRAPAH